MTEEAASATLTDTTGTGVTVIVAVAIFVSLTAAIVATPGENVDTSPLAETVATPGASLLQSIFRPVSTMLWASSSVAVSCWEPPVIRVTACGLRAIEATGAGVTVIVALPLLPSLVAVTLAVPTDTAVSTPVAETVTTAGSLELHITPRPVNTPPFASIVVAVAWAVPTAVMEFGVRLTLTDATGIAVTVTDAVPIFPSLVAVISAAPGATAETIPAADTVVTLALLEVHATRRPLRTSPLLARIIAVACVVAPAMSEDAASVTPTDATGIGTTVRAMVTVTPPADALMLEEPGASAVTNPPAATVATSG
jgi:hypothetical protein